MVGYTGFREKSTKILKKEKANLSIEISEDDIFLRLILKDQFGNLQMFLNHFVKHDLRIRTFFEKEEVTW